VQKTLQSLFKENEKRLLNSLLKAICNQVTKGVASLPPPPLLPQSKCCYRDMPKMHSNKFSKIAKRWELTALSVP